MDGMVGSLSSSAPSFSSSFSTSASPSSAAPIPAAAAAPFSTSASPSCVGVPPSLSPASAIGVVECASSGSVVAAPLALPPHSAGNASVAALEKLADNEEKGRFGLKEDSQSPLPVTVTVYGTLDRLEDVEDYAADNGSAEAFRKSSAEIGSDLDGEANGVLMGEHLLPVTSATESNLLAELQQILSTHPSLSEHENILTRACKLAAMVEEHNARAQGHSRSQTQTPHGLHSYSNSMRHAAGQGSADSLHSESFDSRAPLAVNVDARSSNARSSKASVDVNHTVFDRVQRECAMTFNESEMNALSDEVAHPARQPKFLYMLCLVNAMAAIVQGMDETVVNGAQIFYFDDLNLHNSWLQGLVNAAPYLACAVISVWLTAPMNEYLGRRGTIFVMCILAAVTSVWEGLCNSWENLFLARFFLGVSIGAKSTTVPMYSSESAPTAVRGALTSLWQMFTAFGIFLGYLVDVALVDLPPDRNWRWMLASTAVAPTIVCMLVYLPPESPRWLMKQQRYPQAFQSLLRLRTHPIIAARDFVLLHSALQESRQQQQPKLSDLVSSTRNERATQASLLLMFMQQLCGVNVIMYYSSQIFVSAAGVSQTTAIYSSLGAGAINFLFALPALYLIDKLGRRPLVLRTFPVLSVCLFFTAASFAADERARLAMVCIGIYVYMAVYSMGEGPVPFTYAAEAFPLEIRDLGMSLAVAVTWFFSFLLSLLWPSMLDAFQPAGAFAFYGAWCAVGFVLIYFVVPETKNISLEELDKVFSEPLSSFATRKWKTLINALHPLKASCQRAPVSLRESST